MPHCTSGHTDKSGDHKLEQKLEKTVKTVEKSACHLKCELKGYSQGMSIDGYCQCSGETGFVGPVSGNPWVQSDVFVWPSWS